MKNRTLSTYRNTKSENLYPSRDKSEIGPLTMDELNRSNKELEQFAFLAAHDLQEPLKVAYSYIKLLDKKYRGKLDDKADNIIASILENTERMQKLIQNLLTYSRAGQGKGQFKKLDCSILLGRAIENLKVNIEENLAQIRYEGCQVVRGDEIQLTQLFQNLINNAIKFRKKEAAPYIHISARQKDREWVFSIQDNGVGMEPEDTQSIFDLFRRLHSPSECVGNGIGLALCKRIVECHQGRIWVESKIGHGTTVYFTIPKNEELGESYKEEV